MTPADVNKAVKKIRLMAKDDDEAAHSAEDALYHEVLTAIANFDCSDPAKCARAALKTKTIRFARWVA